MPAGDLRISAAGVIDHSACRLPKWTASSGARSASRLGRWRTALCSMPRHAWRTVVGGCARAPVTRYMAHSSPRCAQSSALHSLEAAPSAASRRSSPRVTCVGRPWKVSGRPWNAVEGRGRMKARSGPKVTRSSREAVAAIAREGVAARLGSISTSTERHSEAWCTTLALPPASSPPRAPSPPPPSLPVSDDCEWRSSAATRTCSGRSSSRVEWLASECDASECDARECESVRAKAASSPSESAEDEAAESGAGRWSPW